MATGSPPRVRGKLRDLTLVRFLLGITPACAGKTSSQHRVHEGAEDHPRVCGENYVGFNSKHYDQGSPPRVRGKQSWTVTDDGQRRITPACAGKTELDSD